MSTTFHIAVQTLLSGRFLKIGSVPSMTSQWAFSFTSVGGANGSWNDASYNSMVIGFVNCYYNNNPAPYNTITSYMSPVKFGTNANCRWKLHVASNGNLYVEKASTDEWMKLTLTIDSNYFTPVQFNGIITESSFGGNPGSLVHELNIT